MTYLTDEHIIAFGIVGFIIIMVGIWYLRQPPE